MVAAENEQIIKRSYYIMECKKIGITSKQAESDKAYKSLQAEISYIMDAASSQPRVAWLTLFHAGNVLHEMAHIVRKECNID